MSPTATLLALLRRHYIKPGEPLPGGIFLPEVGLNGSTGASSRADALYVGFTSTSGRLLVGHELKVSRADWLNELNKPGKADTWADECHEWWIVTPDVDLILPGELPDGWGHMVPGKSKTRMRVVVKAHTHRDRTPSWRATRSIMARQDTLRAQAVADGIAKARQTANAEVEERVAQQLEWRLHQQGDVAALQAELDRYRKALGGRLVDDDGPRYWGEDHTEADLRHAATFLRHFRDLRAAVDALVSQYGPLATMRSDFDDLDKAITAAASLTEPREADR